MLRVFSSSMRVVECAREHDIGLAHTRHENESMHIWKRVSGRPCMGRYQGADALLVRRLTSCENNNKAFIDP